MVRQQTHRDSGGGGGARFRSLRLLKALGSRVTDKTEDDLG